MSPHVGNFPREYPKPLSIHPAAFVPQLDSYDWAVDAVRLRNRVALSTQEYIAPINLPNGASITKVTLYGYRDDGAADLSIEVRRNDRAGNSGFIAEVVADWTDGYGSKSEEDIDNAQINNTAYGYSVRVHLNPNDDVGDCQLTGVEIEWA